MSELTDEELAEISQLLVRAAETGDHALTDRFYTDDTVIWINWDRTEKRRDPDDPHGDFDRIDSVMRDAKAEIVRIQRCDHGVVVQLVLRATICETGSPMELHNCMIITIDDGQFTRVDEYVDPNMLLQVPADVLAPIQAGRSTSSE